MMTQEFQTVRGTVWIFGTLGGINAKQPLYTSLKFRGVKMEIEPWHWVNLEPSAMQKYGMQEEADMQSNSVWQNYYYINNCNFPS